MDIRHIVGKVYYRVKMIIEPPKNKWSIEKVIAGAMTGYKRAYGYTFDIDRPVLFSEKVIWYKVFWNREGLVNIVDKYLFKEYLRSKVGKKYVVPLYGAWKSVNDELQCRFGLVRL